MKARDRKGVTRFWKRLQRESDALSQVMIENYIRDVMKRPKVKTIKVHACSDIPEYVIRCDRDENRIVNYEKDRLAMNIGRQLMNEGYIAFTGEKIHHNEAAARRITAGFRFYVDDKEKLT